MNIYRKIIASLQLREAIRKADAAHAKNGGRYYVMPTFNDFRRGKPGLLIMDRRNFRKLKHKGYINPKATVRDLVTECFYFTAHADGGGTITKEFLGKKRRQYFSWYSAELQAARANRKRVRQDKKKTGGAQS